MLRLRHIGKFNIRVARFASQPTSSIPDLPDIVPPKPQAGKPIEKEIEFKEEAIELVEDMTIEKWDLKSSLPESIGKVFSINESIMERFPSASVSSYLNKQFKLTANSGLLFRASSHSLLNELDSDSSKVSDRTILLCKRLLSLAGARGSGKSTTMFQMVNHYANNGYIVLYFPKLSEWTSGIFSYESVGETYHQPELACKLLQTILTANESHLKKLKAPDGKTSMADFVSAGSKNPRISHQTLMEFLDNVFKSTDRPKILLALDQINAIFTNTAYCDKDSNPLTADKFAIAAKFHSLLQTELTNAARLIAVDNSVTQIKSPYLEIISNKAHSLNKDPLRLHVQKYQKVPAEELDAILPRTTLNNGFPDIQIKNLQNYVIPALDKPETLGILDFYRKTSVLRQASVDEDYVKKQWMISQGNALELFKASTL
ncbi:37S ribosomal protein S23 mitochondrial [Boothiomyces sp. JEL0838]|nr:37S ribosomal protein S23 mitochondrial [Boothiomyces sp. JEL0838]